ncbi:MAG: hypothetical protein Q8R96_06660 [Bacteroidota bacterium]|nr:hypothetical protein [Bacteroidota bacterium]
MKKLFFFAFTISVFITVNFSANAQLGGLMNKVKNKVVDKALGNSDSDKETKVASVKDDPLCACSDATVAFKFTEGLKINYKEATFSVSEDGTLLVFDMVGKKYYTAKNGVLQGPYEADDPIVSRFDLPEAESGDQISMDVLLERYKGFIVPSGEKYAINFGGKTYGPFAVIQSFVLNHSKSKFAAMVVKDVLMTEDQGKILELEAKNAKTDQERMQLAMKMSEQMQERMMAAGGEIDMLPKLISNVPEAKSDMMLGNNFSGKVKFDDIVNVGFDKITDLTGKTLLSFDPQKLNNSGNGFWLSSDNTRIASYNYGLLSLSDGKEFAEVFCPYVMKAEGKVYLSYMYFSPVNNAVMQCKLPF